MRILPVEEVCLSAQAFGDEGRNRSFLASKPGQFCSFPVTTQAYTAPTRTSTVRAPLLTFLLTVLVWFSAIDRVDLCTNAEAHDVSPRRTRSKLAASIPPLPWRVR